MTTYSGTGNNLPDRLPGIIAIIIITIAVVAFIKAFNFILNLL